MNVMSSVMAMASMRLIFILTKNLTIGLNKMDINRAKTKGTMIP